LHRGATLALAATGTGECLSGGADGAVHVVDAARALRRTLRCPNPYVRFVAHDAESGNTLAWSSATAAGARGTVRLWRADGEPVWTLDDVSACTGFAGDAFACARGDVAEVLAAADGSLRATLRGHSGPLTSIAWDAEGTRLLMTAADGTAKLWSVRSLRELWCAGTHEAPGILAGSPDRRCFATGGDDRRVRLWNFAERCLRATIELPDEPRCFDFDPTSARLVVGGTSGDLHWLDVESGLVTRTAKAHATQVDFVAFAPVGNRLASVDQSGGLLLWPEPSSPAPIDLGPEIGTCCGLSFSPRGDRLVAVAREGTIAVWQAGERRPLARWQGHAGPIRAVAVLPGSETIVSAGDDGALRAWGMDGSLRRHEQAHSGAVTCLVSVGPEAVLSASVDGTVRRWEVAGTAAPVIVATIGRPVTALAAAGLRWVAFDAGAAIWLGAPGAPPVRHPLASPPAGAPCLDSRGDFAVTLSLDGSVRFWPIDISEHARRHAPRSMTAEERAWFRLPALSQTATR
jgi:WD40 repeat protein